MSHKKAPNLCDHHLEDLYAAIKKGDAHKVYLLEHKLNQTEKCVACSYALKAQGDTKEILEKYLVQEGVLRKKFISKKDKIRYWGTKGLMVSLLLAIFIAMATVFKRLLFSPSAPVNIGSFGAMAAFVLSIAVFVLLENWLFED